METVHGLFLHSFDDIFSYIRLSFFLTFHDGKIGFRSERNGQYFYRTSKGHNWKRSVKMSKTSILYLRAKKWKDRIRKIMYNENVDNKFSAHDEFLE